MFDTWKIRLYDFEVSERPKLTLANPTTFLGDGVSASTYPLFNVNGEVVRGCGAYHNGDDFNVTIKKIAKNNAEYDAEYDFGRVECFVQFSAPKVVNGDNFNLSDAPTTVKACQGIEDRLKDIGIKTNVRDAFISRLDVAKNIQVSEPTQSYFPVLGMLQGKRMSKRDYGTTYTWGNKSHEICAYDKLAEMAKRKVSTANISPTIRLEWRLLKAAKFRAATSMRTVNDVLNDYGHIEQCYRASMAKQLFSADVPTFERLRASDIEREMKLFQERGNKSWWRDWVMASSLKGVLPDFDTILSSAVKLSTNRMQTSRIRKDFQAARMDAMALVESENPDKQNLSQLYGELKDKTLAI
jgi:hypothetical protein